MEPEKQQKIKTEMEKSIALAKDPELKRIFAGIMERVQKDDSFREIREIKKKIIGTPRQSRQLVLAFIPHEMAKVSIFFPMSDRELKEENRRINILEHESAWGKIMIEGVKLAIFEEDIFLALMKIAQKKMQPVKGQYVLEINMKEIIHLLYGTSGYSTKKTTCLIIKSLDHFQLVKFTLTLFDKKAGKGKKEGLRGSIGNIVQSHYYDPKTQDLKIKFNPDFCIFFLESMLTNINLTLRRKLKKDGSKALLRFLAAHRNPGKMHILTVLNAINYNIDQPTFRLRSRFKGFVKELKENGVLGPKTRLYGDIVHFDVLPPKKSLHS